MTSESPLPSCASAVTKSDAQSAVRARVIAEARALFAEYGYSKTNIGDIAQAAGMSPANLYRYFRNKQAIGEAVVRRHAEKIDVRKQEILAAPDLAPEARLRLYVSDWVAMSNEPLMRAPRLIELADMLMETPEGVAFLVERSVAERARFRQLLELGRDSGDFKFEDLDATLRGVLRAFRSFFSPFGAVRFEPEEIEADLKATLNLVCAGLRAGL